MSEFKCTDCDETTSKDAGGRVCVQCRKGYCETHAAERFSTHAFLCDTCVADKDEALGEDALEGASEDARVTLRAVTTSISRPHNSRSVQGNTYV